MSGSVQTLHRALLDDLIQRAAPHRHWDPPEAESFVVLEGEIACFIFDDAGSLVRTADHAVCYEVKPGPYSVASGA
jgi:uncharacterized cupin superfamily protein